MSVEENDLNDWDENFLNQVLQIELEAISSRNPTQSAAFAAPSSSHLGFGGGGGGGGAEFISFSPPRELSQRFVERPEPESIPENDFRVADPARFPRDGGWRVGGRGGDSREIERLKKELGKVTKQLNQAKNECLELQRERDSKDEQLNRAFLEISSKETEINILKTEREHEVSIPDRSQPTLRLRSKGIGSDQNVLRYPLSVANCSLGTAKGKERRGKTLYNNSKNAVESTFELPPDDQVHGKCNTFKKIVETDGIAVSEPEHCIFVDNGLTSSSGFCVQEKCTKVVGIQTDPVEDCSLSTAKDVISKNNDVSNTLLAIWGLPGNKRSANIVSKLFATCAKDFFVLFRFMSMSTKIALDYLGDDILSDVAVDVPMQPISSVDAAKVSHLYTTLMKLNSGVVALQDFLGAILDLCNLENKVVIHRSLHILHLTLQHALSCDIRLGKRENVVVTSQSQLTTFVGEKEAINPNIATSEFIELQSAHDKAPFLDSMSVKTNYCHLESVNNEKDISFGISASFPSVDWISIFDLMHQITARKTEECIRVEAISVMNLILMKTKFSSEREMFGVMPLFESISRLLRKEVGSRVQEQAVHLLFLLLNCPKLLVKFCIRDEDNMEDGEVDRAQKDTSTFQGVFSGILEGLAECVICAGNGIQEMKLRRRAVIILAFIVSSGKSGFEFFLSSRTPQGVNFLELVIRALAMETETETSGLAETQDICKERHLFMREALILLNRVASNPIYATAVLGALTSSKATLGLTIDVMNRMSRKGRFYDGLKEPQESELIDLAQSFITRILSFLGERVS